MPGLVMPVHYSSTMNAASHFVFTGVAWPASTFQFPASFTHNFLPTQGETIPLLVMPFVDFRNPRYQRRVTEHSHLNISDFK
jgi:hypothetical protein